MTTFAALGTPKALADTLTAQGIETPFPIQVKTLPDTLAGATSWAAAAHRIRQDHRFAIPLVARLAEREAQALPQAGPPHGPAACTDRELATQINATIEPMAKAMGLNTTVIYGGILAGRQKRHCAPALDIVIGLPGPPWRTSSASAS
jgi:superfamily II DNA/RNA helicase